MANGMSTLENAVNGRKRPVLAKYVKVTGITKLSYCLAVWWFASQQDVVERLQHSYTSFMRWIGWMGLALLCLSLVAVGSESAHMGAAFSNVYSAFAPLSLLHRSYADFLFNGTSVSVSAGLSGACEATAIALAEMHLELLQQTGSHVVETIPRLARLRADSAGLCATHSDMLASLSQIADANMSTLEAASQQGLFSSIYGLQQRLQFMLDAYLEGIPNDQATWEFAVAFSLHTLLLQQPMVAIDPSLRAILYGSEQATVPPAFVPDDIADAIILVVSSGESSGEGVAAEAVREQIELIYAYVMDAP